MEASEPEISTDRCIRISKGRHPLLDPKECVPLDFEIGGEVQGIVITGPNTGGKTVAIKTVGLLCLMACSGLHIPCDYAKICMNNQVLCDIGDGQNISENLSTFSAHLTNIIRILKSAGPESLVLLDELGSGTDPAEGMGIAVSILEQLKECGCLFLVTTHYPEVKEYAKDRPGIQNARMAFDRESLRPLYRLEIGRAGESCALYIAKRLGLPDDMLRRAAQAAYGEAYEESIRDLALEADGKGKIKREHVQGIERIPEKKKVSDRAASFVRGDSVMVYPEKKIGIVVEPADDQGRILVQIRKEKQLCSHKRLRLHVPASRLYPPDYDFSIVFDSVENRKKRHQMERKYSGDLEIQN
jgi:DNA mismatch repair protein MutS2